MTKRISSRRKSFCSVRTSNGNVFSSAMMRLRFHLLGLGPGFLDDANHVERLFRQVVMLAFEDLTEAAHGIGDAYILAGNAGKLFGHEVRLREEALDLARPRDGEVVVFAQFFHAENRNDV